ncbi:3-demethylubiquinone-9 3-methyltransferase [Sorangium cellulosum]|uniref:3-demethylubiquinone-9 3-methyltransferase n=1 Tax=Sorangium cellulosum TaxID=56 RepID=A0A2L0EMS0_SORCE|nr:class I SAM-dependent methyltransferase [Sorangium cellulosum]AUX40603.1 3-demethylubiquinone-9 3-methyltransferase [Sorangium cellulosum]
MQLTSQDYWEEHWQKHLSAADLSGGFELYDDIAPFLPRGEDVSFLEIGCAPGRILAEFCGRLGFTAYGLDYAGDPSIIEQALTARGIRLGKVEKGDFFSWNPGEKFDIVASFGFIEHFDDAAAVVDRHFEMVKPGGMVVVSMPNFAGGQKALHWLFDRRNLDGHNTRIMNVPFLEAAARRNRAEIVQARYTGGHFDFWLDRAAPLLARRVVWRLVPPIQALARWMVPGEVNPWFSPYLFAIYRAPVSAGGGARRVIRSDA